MNIDKDQILDWYTECGKYNSNSLASVLAVLVMLLGTNPVSTMLGIIVLITPQSPFDIPAAKRSGKIFPILIQIICVIIALEIISAFGNIDSTGISLGGTSVGISIVVIVSCIFIMILAFRAKTYIITIIPVFEHDRSVVCKETVDMLINAGVLGTHCEHYTTSDNKIKIHWGKCNNKKELSAVCDFSVQLYASLYDLPVYIEYERK